MCCSLQVDDVRNAVRERFEGTGYPKMWEWLLDVRVESQGTVAVVVAARDALPVDALFQTTQKAGTADELHEFWTWNTEENAKQDTEHPLAGQLEVQTLYPRAFEGFRFHYVTMPRA